MWRTILNHIDKQECLTGLKKLAGPIYKEWGISSDKFGLEYQYDEDLISYAATDSQATYHLFNEANLHKDFQQTTVTPLVNLLPIKHPKDFNPGRRHFYESVIKPMIEPIAQVSLNGINLDLNKVQTLADKLDKVMLDALNELHKSRYVQQTLIELNKNKVQKYKADRESKLKEYTYFIRPFNKTKIDHRSYLIEALLAEQNISYDSGERLPNNHVKWSVNAVKKLMAETDSTEVISFITMLNEDTLSSEATLVKQAMYNLAIAKRDLNSNNMRYKAQILNPEEFLELDLKFNPKSNPSIQKLFENLQITPLAFTDTNAPSWGREQLVELTQILENEDKLFVVKQLLNISEVSTTRSNFVENFLK